MKTVRRDKGIVAKRPGVWLGIIARTQEVLIGTNRGVIKCKTVARLVDQEKWDVKQITQMRGTPWEPVPGKMDRRVPVAIDDDGNGVQDNENENVELDAHEE